MARDRELTVEQVAAWARVSVETVRRWIRQGHLHARKPGRDYVLPTSSLRAFINDNTLPATTARSR